MHRQFLYFIETMVAHPRPGFVLVEGADRQGRKGPHIRKTCPDSACRLPSPPGEIVPRVASDLSVVSLADAKGTKPSIGEKTSTAETDFTIHPQHCIVCFACRHTGHTAVECPTHAGKCFRCGARGHTRKECTSTYRNANRGLAQDTACQTPWSETSSIETQTDSSFLAELRGVTTAGQKPPSPYPAEVVALATTTTAHIRSRSPGAQENDHAVNTIVDVNFNRSTGAQDSETLATSAADSYITHQPTNHVAARTATESQAQHEPSGAQEREPTTSGDDGVDAIVNVDCQLEASTAGTKEKHGINGAPGNHPSTAEPADNLTTPQQSDRVVASIVTPPRRAPNEASSRAGAKPESIERTENRIDTDNLTATRMINEPRGNEPEKEEMVDIVTPPKLEWDERKNNTESEPALSTTPIPEITDQQKAVASTRVRAALSSIPRNGRAKKILELGIDMAMEVDENLAFAEMEKEAHERDLFHAEANIGLAALQQLAAAAGHEIHRQAISRLADACLAGVGVLEVLGDDTEELVSRPSRAALDAWLPVSWGE